RRFIDLERRVTKRPRHYYDVLRFCASSLQTSSIDGMRRAGRIAHGTVNFVRLSEAQPPVKSSSQKYFTLPKFGFIVQAKRPGPRKGAVVRRHEPRAGLRWTRAASARMSRAGRGSGLSRTP